ncbi:putative F-box protein [Tanacetum coccineum]
MKPAKPKRTTMEVHVPHDVVSNHILPRVPTKSVCRFKCVSKEWHSFLTSDMFKNKHNRLHVDDHQNNNKLLVFSKTETSFGFTTIDCEVPPSDKDVTPTCRPLPPFEDSTTPYHIHILTSFHGLVCLGIIKESHNFRCSDLILLNPLTNEYKRLSKSNPLTNEYSKFGLYYRCCEDDYKLLCLNLFDDYVSIYSLKSDSWRKVDGFPHTSRLCHERWSQGTYLNENLYFLQQNSNNGRLSSIIRFDTKTERFSNIETPNVDANPNAYFHFATIMVKSDCIHVCVKYTYRNCDSGFERTTCIKLWKYEYGKMIEVNGNWLMKNWSFNNHPITNVVLKKKMRIKEKGNIYDDFEYAEVRVDGNNKIIAEEVDHCVSLAL